ncbi:hypothetical protein, partial [Metallosphaera sp.]|uniref:hypothetical protein n=1 Tax=Metallosphaera sp. TaxID=2020860 RepID=UPI00317BD974
VLEMRPHRQGGGGWGAVEQGGEREKGQDRGCLGTGYAGGWWGGGDVWVWRRWCLADADAELMCGVG